MAAGAAVSDRCTQYALDVVASVIIAGEYVRLASVPEYSPMCQPDGLT